MIVQHHIIALPAGQKVLHTVTTGSALEVQEGIVATRLTIQGLQRVLILHHMFPLLEPALQVGVGIGGER